MHQDMLTTNIYFVKCKKNVTTHWKSTGHLFLRAGSFTHLVYFCRSMEVGNSGLTLLKEEIKTGEIEVAEGEVLLLACTRLNSSHPDSCSTHAGLLTSRIPRWSWG